MTAPRPGWAEQILGLRIRAQQGIVQRVGRDGVAVLVKLRGGSTFFTLALLDGVGEVNGQWFLGEKIKEIIGTLLRIRFEGIVDARAGKQARVDDGGVCVVVSTVIIKPHARGRVWDADGGFAVDGHVVIRMTEGARVGGVVACG